jgi:hypothetical protein
MSHVLLCCLLALAVVGMTVSVAQADGPQLAHMVYFKLKDSSEGSRKKLVDACHKYLTKHDGEIYFSAGLLATDLKRDVNDLDWDVALIIIFKDKAAHDKYQAHPRHQDFIKAGKDNWAKVRVFDSYLAPKTGAAAGADEK